MSDFVEQCRREWRHLGVTDQLADEMAADLASDLSEARAEGISIEEYLGAGASDPRSFATSWATERGIVPDPQNLHPRRRKPASLVAFTSLAALALIVAALLLATGEPQVTLKTHRVPPTQVTARQGAHYLPPPHEVQSSAAAPIEWMLLFLAAAGLAFTARLWLRWNLSRLPTVPT